MKHDIEAQRDKRTVRARHIGFEQSRRIDQYLADEKRKGRLSLLECRSCFYLRTPIGGAAMTEATCQACEQPFTHSSTAVPAYCTACAEKHQVCRRCGSALDYEDIESSPTGWCVRLPFGFRWGGIEVTRVAYDRHRGKRVMLVKTAIQHLVIQVTPAGKISGHLGKSTGENIDSFTSIKRRKV